MYTGVVTALLNKYADPILKGVTGFAKDGWEKFKATPRNSQIKHQVLLGAARI